MKKISILGSTGSIGRQALEVIESFPDRFEVCSLCAGSNIALLKEQIEKFSPSAVCVSDEEKARELEKTAHGKTDIVFGREGLCELAADESETVVSAIVGFAGLEPTLTAVRKGKRVALANKELIVAAGQIVMDEVRASSAEIIPVDSEHSAVFQSMRAGGEVRRLIITASGGPFLNTPQDTLEKVSPAQALNHPTWDMGDKITIDSATMMNKAFEVIEARWLFDVPPEKIEVWIHPQSVVHSIVEFEDGSAVCQMSEPDMRVPIAFALSYPERLALQTERLSPARLSQTSFEEADTRKTIPLALALRALDEEGTMPGTMNAANEEAVKLFLDNRIKFTDIVKIVETVMDGHKTSPAETVEQVLQADAQARKEAGRAAEMNEK
ncbi:MAG: 1-deoxy-D-xylulose-5-phosphate reductoisomerase [Candidatus Mycalebacterium zealandia]|nr:MAG: 1-deoxy-D-xylulose-5-phosphate reductoisomerase [Candidatus Mycalebacterium zealandia]